MSCISSGCVQYPTLGCFAAFPVLSDFARTSPISARCGRFPELFLSSSRSRQPEYCLVAGIAMTSALPWLAGPFSGFAAKI